MLLRSVVDIFCESSTLIFTPFTLFVRFFGVNKTRTQNIHPLQIQLWPFLSVNDHVCITRGLCFQIRYFTFLANLKAKSSCDTYIQIRETSHVFCIFVCNMCEDSSSLHILETKIQKTCEVVKLYWFFVIFIYWVYHLLGYGKNTFDCCDNMGTIMTLFPDCF